MQQFSLIQQIRQLPKISAFLLAINSVSVEASPLEFNFMASLHEARLNDFYTSNSSTNPNFTSGIKVYDYFQSGFLSNGEYRLEQLEILNSQVSSNISGGFSYDKTGAQITTDISDWGGGDITVYQQSTVNNPQNSIFSTSINVLGNNFDFIGQVFDQLGWFYMDAQLNNFKFTQFSAGTSNIPNIYLDIPTIERQINWKNACCWDPTRMEVLSSATNTHRFYLDNIFFSFNAANGQIDNLLNLDIADPDTVNKQILLSFRDQQQPGSFFSGGQLTLTYNIDTLTPVPLPPSVGLMVLGLIGLITPKIKLARAPAISEV